MVICICTFMIANSVELNLPPYIQDVCYLPTLYTRYVSLGTCPKSLLATVEYGTFVHFLIV